ncbi:hypothetical protein BDV11DRAFT_172702 [Aspergillus similis]
MSVLCLLLAAIQVAIFADCATIPRPFNQSSSGFLTLDFPSSCDVACQTAYIQGLAHDANHFVHPDVTLDPFYTTPASFPSYAVGDLVKWEDIDSTTVSTYWVPAGLSLSRFFCLRRPRWHATPSNKLRPVSLHQPPRLQQALSRRGLGPWYLRLYTTVRSFKQQGSPVQLGSTFSLAQQGYVVIAPDYA